MAKVIVCETCGKYQDITTGDWLYREKWDLAIDNDYKDYRDHANENPDHVLVAGGQG